MIHSLVIDIIGYLPPDYHFIYFLFDFLAYCLVLVVIVSPVFLVYRLVIRYF